MNLALMSKELDPYFVGRANGVAVPKPTRRLTTWWRQIIDRMESVRTECWTEVAYALLGVAVEDQEKFAQQCKKLTTQIKRARAPHKHNWVALRSGTQSERHYGIIGYPHHGLTRDERNTIMQHAVAELEHDGAVFGTVVLAIDMNHPSAPYDALAFVPGSAPGAISFRRLVFRNPERPNLDTSFHLKNPNPRS